MSTSYLKVGIVGCGFVSQSSHLPAWAKQGNARVVAVCDRNVELARQAAGKFNIAHVYSSLSEMLSSEELDIVDICTSIETHHPLIMQAMEAGCHILVEKPMTSTIKEADEVIELQRRKAVKLCVVHNMLFMPAVLKIKSIVNKGLIGDIVGMDIRHICSPEDYPDLTNPDSWVHRLRGGIFGERLPHPVYLTSEFLGELKLQGVFPRKAGSIKHLPVDEVHIVVTGTRGTGTITMAFNGPTVWQVNIYGTKMNIHANLNNSYAFVYGGKSKNGVGMPALYARENLYRASQIISDTLSVGIKFLSKNHRTHPALFAAYIQSILNGEESPVTAEQSRQNIQLIQLISERL